MAVAVAYPQVALLVAAMEGVTWEAPRDLGGPVVLVEAEGPLGEVETVLESLVEVVTAPVTEGVEGGLAVEEKEREGGEGREAAA